MNRLPPSSTSCHPSTGTVASGLPRDGAVHGAFWLSFLLAAGGLRGDEIAVRPVADCELRELSPTSNFGNGLTFVSGGLGTMAAGEARRSLIRFSLADVVPPGSTVTSVTLRVAVVRLPANPMSSSFELRRVGREWAEVGASWNLRLLPDLAWEQVGVSGPGDREESASSSLEFSGLGAYTFPSTVALVGDVQRWVDDPASNHGWLLTSEGEEDFRTARHFASREDSVSGPVLTVSFTSPAPALGPVMTRVRMVGNVFTFEFPMEEGRGYTVESAGMAWPPVWTTVTNATGVAGTTNAIVSAPATEAGRVYRVRSP